MEATQTNSEAKENLRRLQVRWLSQLKRRLNAGQITQQYYDSQVWLAYQKLENPDVVYWETLLSEVAQNATVNLPETVATAGGYVKNGVKSVATGAGELISGAASGLGSGFFSKLTAKGSLVFFTALIGYLIFKGFITPKTFKR